MKECVKITISDLIIDEEFEKVIPPLTEEEFELLEESIIGAGEVYNPIFVWNNIIIDGHHRCKILREHPEIKYRIAEINFGNRAEAISWICLNQLARRNLTTAQKTMLIGRRYKAEKQAHGASDGFRGNQYRQADELRCKNCTLPENDSKTANKIALENGVSPRSVHYAEDYVDGVDAAEEFLPGITKDITSGKIKPNQADVRAIAKAPLNERKQMAERLYKPLTPEQKEKRRKNREMNKIIRSCDARHFPTDENKIEAEDMLMTFSSESEKFVETMDFCLGYSPELLTEPMYFEQVEKVIQPIKDYFKNLEENRSVNNFLFAK